MSSWIVRYVMIVFIMAIMVYERNSCIGRWMVMFVRFLFWLVYEFVADFLDCGD